MSTFRSVNDGVLVDLIKQAERRIVYIAPGLYLPVAQALCRRFSEMDDLSVTLVLDADEDVCRIGYGEIEALKQVHAQSSAAGFFVRSQPGLRVGILLADDQTMIWSPTPCTVEAAPDEAANGVFLGSNPNEQIAHAVCAEGTETSLSDAEIGTAAITPAQVDETAEALAGNPPIPVDLARITRVFSTKLQFVELKVAGSRLSQQQVRIPSDLLNADAEEQLRTLLDTNLRVFAEYREIPVDVPMYVRGEPAFGSDGQPLTEPVSEISLERERKAMERDFLFDMGNFGRLMERARRAEFEKCIEAFKVRLEAHSEGVRRTIAESSDAIIKDAVNLIIDRITRSGHQVPDPGALYARLSSSMGRVEGEIPKVSVVFKEVTFEQTQDENFRRRLNTALPLNVKRRLGEWFEQFTAARHNTRG